MPSPKLTARKADRHYLYENSVQNADYDALFVKRLYRRVRKREAISIKEDFCGTFTFCCEWVKLNPNYTAVGVDIHAPTLDWGRKHNLSRLTRTQQTRLKVLNKNVLDVTTPKVDAVCAFNFSYFLFKKREELKQYFKTAHRSLNQHGVFFLDAFGGSEALMIQEEKRKCKGYTYIWEHADYNPVTSEIMCKIHFEFPDGTRMRNAFLYDWRLWTLQELQELLRESGFREVQVFWEGTDQDSGTGNGVFRRTTKGEACQSWVAYLAALK